jgi:hypothetical protein
MTLNSHRGKYCETCAARIYKETDERQKRTVTKKLF